jgi:nicotinamidase-related amidase
MPLTQIDSKAALLVIDLQKGVIVMAPSLSEQVIVNSAKLANRFRERGLPVVLVNVTGVAPGRNDAGRRSLQGLPADWSELVAALDPQPQDLRVSKQCYGAFAHTLLDESLRKQGVTQVFMTGVSTSVGVESTARAAYDLGYNVVLVSDAMADRDPEMHRHSVEKFFPKLGEVDTTENVLKMLAKTVRSGAGA